MKEGDAVKYIELLDEIKKEIQQEINEEYIPVYRRLYKQNIIRRYCIINY